MQNLIDGLNSGGTAVDSLSESERNVRNGVAHMDPEREKSVVALPDVVAEIPPVYPWFGSPSSDDTPVSAEDLATPQLTVIRKVCYGVGHVLNDLCAAMWFSYLLVFFHSVLNFTNTYAGGIILLGQVADAVATPFVGIESDQSASGFFGYGRRKSWHLIGTVAVIASFPFLFIDCIGCHSSQDWAKFIYYAPFVVIFQFGWAAVQIAHLALIPDLATRDLERVELNAIRYGWTVISNLAVYVLTWLILRTDANSEKRVSPEDAGTFRMIVFIVIGVGTLFSLVFHIGVKEYPLYFRATPESSIETSSELSHVSVHMTWKDWFNEPQFYIVSILYMSSRLFVNLTQVYLPMYLLDTLGLGKDSIGYIPLVVYLTGFAASMIMKPMNRFFGNKVSCIVGVGFGLGACSWIQFFVVDGRTVYGVAALLGISGTVLMVGSLAVTTELIAGSTSTGAFVFGVMSFADKLSNGLAVMAIQLLHPATPAHSEHSSFFVKVMVYVPAAACTVALVSVLFLIRQTVGVRHRDRDRLSSQTYKDFINQNDEDRQAMLSDSSESLVVAQNVS